MSRLPERLLIHEVDVIVPVRQTSTYNEDDGPLDYDNGATTRITARLQQDSRNETYQDGRTPVEQMWQLFTNADAVITAQARVVWPERGLTFDVYGQPEPVYDGSKFSHTEATLRILEG